ncbi:TetR/AcrR family transcriptional regulator [Streptomyces sp. NPDC059575]|uniref:TetR/AcrR family transcriptional regulator n=1 Tax=Streptomyces sp. NPDC059575 TaxID=3346872 RepID=UPI0036A3E66A
MSPTPQQRRAARHGAGPSTSATRRGPSGGRKKPITVDAIIDTAFGIVEREGYAALTMRRVATALETGPSSLYAHVVNKEDLDELLIGRLCAEIELPEPDPAHWRRQITDVCARLRDQYLRYPGISQAAFAAAPSNLDTLRVGEGMLAILLAGDIAPQAAAWAIDSLMLYVNAYSLEVSLANSRVDRDAEPGADTGEFPGEVSGAVPGAAPGAVPGAVPGAAPGVDGWVVGRDELLRRFAALPDTFPQTKRYAAELTAGTVHDRFDFTIGLMIDGLGASGR